MTTKFACIWFEPTYDTNISLETLESLEDEHRGFGIEELSNIESLGVKEQYESDDLLIIRVS